VFRIRIGFMVPIRVRIRIRIQGFDDQKLKKFTAENRLLFFMKKINFIYLGLHKERLSYRRSLQLSKVRTSSTSKRKISSLFLFLRIQPTKIIADAEP
jgi:hypothetical protein